MTTQQPGAVMAGAPTVRRNTSFWAAYAQCVRALVYVFVGMSALAIVGMMVVTCLEVILRIFGVSITGVVDIVRICAALAMAGALPYTTACKGHVAIEFFFQKLGRPARAVVDAVTRICVIVMFGFLTAQCVKYGSSMWATNQGTTTLQWPEFWVAYVVAASCGLVCLVKAYHLFHPGKELIKP
jgi:TRAP-type C4-dicarboxylate transport system permease small subunit